MDTTEPSPNFTPNLHLVDANEMIPYNRWNTTVCVVNKKAALPQDEPFGLPPMVIFLLFNWHSRRSLSYHHKVTPLTLHRR